MTWNPILNWNVSSAGKTGRNDSAGKKHLILDTCSTLCLDCPRETKDYSILGYYGSELNEDTVHAD